MYYSPHQFETTSLSERQPVDVLPLVERIVLASVKLTQTADPTMRASIRELVRQMNSFYSNRIEGQSTHPHNIERALQRNFSTTPGEARLQRIVVAHIEAEKELEQKREDGAALNTSLLIDAHRDLYARLNLDDLMSDDGAVIVPGQVRTRDVHVGKHMPPIHNVWWETARPTC